MWTLRIVFLALVALVASLLITSTQGCASVPTPEAVMGGISHVAAREQDVETRLAKVYNAMCAGREDNVECVAAMQILAEVNIAKVALYTEIAKLIAAVGGEVVEPEAPPTMELK